MAVVLDASAALSWVLFDERNAETQAMANAVAEDGAIVPALWRWEVQNGLLIAHRRGRIEPQSIAEALESLRALPIEVDSVGSSVAFRSEIELAQRFNLSVYDAAYLDLAIRRGIFIATVDGKLGQAAESLQIRWAPSARKPARSQKRRR